MILVGLQFEVWSHLSHEEIQFDFKCEKHQHPNQWQNKTPS
jgi:hypothetical protein